MRNSQQTQQAKLLTAISAAILVLFVMLILNNGNSLSARMSQPTDLSSRVNFTWTAQQSTLLAKATAILETVTGQAAVEQTGSATALGTNSTPGPSPTGLIEHRAATQTAEMSTLFAQATQIVAGVTERAAMDQTETATVMGTNSTPGPSATERSTYVGATLTAQAILFAQATEILAGVTQQAALTQTTEATLMGTFAATRTPTLTPSPIAPLAQQVGFSDPELDRLEAQQTNILHESVDFSAYDHHYRLMSVWSSRFPSAAPGGAVVLYQTDGGHHKFLWGHDRILTPISLSTPPPGDWNSDGRVYFAFQVATGGNGWGIPSWYYIYELRSDGTVVSALKHAIAPGFVVSGVTLKTDYTLLSAHRLDLTGYYWLKRYYKLVGGQVVDAWTEHIRDYSDTVSGAIYNATTAKVLTDYDERVFAESLFEILVTYEALQQREAGWLLVQDLVSEAKRTNRLAEGTYIDSEFMPTMARLYKEHRSFVPPPVDFSRPATGAYDDE